jgi:aspartyl protease family protein
MLSSRAAALLLFGAASLPALAQNVTLNGRMGERALLVIDGQARTVALGSAVAGVKLLQWAGDDAKVEINGRALLLTPGTPVSMGGGGDGGGGRSIVLPMSPGGHFMGNGAINGRAARFMVDTGATVVSISAADADRMGLNYRNGQRGMVNTANGPATAYRINLNSVRVGDVEVYNVDAVVMPAPMDYVLLGNSFLGRFSMQRDSDTLRLEKK